MLKFEKCIVFRPQHKTDSHLATIESIYYVLKELDSLITMKSVKVSRRCIMVYFVFDYREYKGQYDDLLYFFSYQYALIQEKKLQ